MSYVIFKGIRPDGMYSDYMHFLTLVARYGMRKAIEVYKKEIDK